MACIETSCRYAPAELTWRTCWIHLQSIVQSFLNLNTEITTHHPTNLSPIATIIQTSLYHVDSPVNVMLVIRLKTDFCILHSVCLKSKHRNCSVHLLTKDEWKYMYLIIFQQAVATRILNIYQSVVKKGVMILMKGLNFGMFWTCK